MTLSERLATYEIALSNIKRILESRTPNYEALELIHYTVMEALLDGADLGLEVAAANPLDGPTVPESEWRGEVAPRTSHRSAGSLLASDAPGTQPQTQETPPTQSPTLQRCA